MLVTFVSLRECYFRIRMTYLVKLFGGNYVTRSDKIMNFIVSYISLFPVSSFLQVSFTNSCKPSAPRGDILSFAHIKSKRWNLFFSVHFKIEIFVLANWNRSYCLEITGMQHRILIMYVWLKLWSSLMLWEMMLIYVPLLSVKPENVAGFHFRDSIDVHCFDFDSLLPL
jgi:hypothetical protein